MSFWHKKIKQNDSKMNAGRNSINVAVASFYGNDRTDYGKILAQNLQKNNNLHVFPLNSGLAPEHLKLNSRNIIGIRDFSVNVFQKYSADVIIFGRQERSCICLNFLSYGEYDDLKQRSWRLFDNLYLPLEFFSDEICTESLRNFVYGVLLLCKTPFSAEERGEQKSQLKDIINFFETTDSSLKISPFCTPYILNMMAAIYFAYFADSQDRTSYETIKYMLEKSLQDKESFSSQIHIAPIYMRLGDLFLCAAQNINVDSMICYKKALQAYRLAQNYFKREDFPYEYAQISYLCSEVSFGQWQYSQNLDSLRSAISFLHEVEKIYTEKMFPASWAQIQHELGWYLSLLGTYSNSREVLNLAVKNFNNAQQVFYADKYPYIWLNIQANIGRIYYTIGKKYEDLSALKTAEKLFHAALLVCDEKKANAEKRKIESDISKTTALIYTLEKQYPDE